MSLEYKVVMVKEGGLSTLLFGTAKFPIEKIEETLNIYAQEGWKLSFMVIEKRRFLLFAQREVAIITLSRKKTV